MLGCAVSVLAWCLNDEASRGGGGRRGEAPEAAITGKKRGAAREDLADGR